MRFIALPVGQGDAFYAETDEHFRVLVDGGRSMNAFPELFRSHTKTDRVNVLVCTHNDADHAEGLIGFLKSSLHCDELWLPVTWLDALSSLPQNSKETICFLWRRIVCLTERGDQISASDGDAQETSWHTFFPDLQTNIRTDQYIIDEASTTPKQEPPLSLGTLLEGLLPTLDEHLELFSFYKSFWSEYLFLHLSIWNHIMISVVFNDVRRLLKLTRLALDRGIPIRCFRHDPRNAAPVPGFPLEPLSATLVRYIPPLKPRRSAEDFFRLLYLTTPNKESLVFHLDEGAGRPGILFTADSDLEGVNVQRVLDWSIVTAPHHGSQDNQVAYNLLKKPMIWVRSDGYSRSRPCAAYLNAAGRRFCTLCRNGQRSKQAVRLHLQSGRWVRRQTLPCACL